MARPYLPKRAFQTAVLGRSIKPGPDGCCGNGPFGGVWVGISKNLVAPFGVLMVTQVEACGHRAIHLPQ